MLILAIWAAFTSAMVVFLAYQIFLANDRAMRARQDAWKSSHEANKSSLEYYILVDRYNSLVRDYNALKNRPTQGSLSARDPKLKDRAVKLMELAFSKANPNEANVAQSKLREFITKEL